MALDGKDTGAATPAELPGVSPGKHAVTLSLPGWATQTIEVQATESSPHAAVFAILVGDVPVRIEGLRPGFRVLVDGRETPWSEGVASAGPGERRIGIEHFTIRPEEKAADVRLGATLLLSFTPQFRTPWEQCWPSLVVPGSAQHLQERPRAAALFGGGFAAFVLSAASLRIAAGRTYAAYGELPGTVPPERQQEYLTRVGRLDAAATGLFLAAGVMWAGSVLEAFVRASRE